MRGWSDGCDGYAPMLPITHLETNPSQINSHRPAAEFGSLFDVESEDTMRSIRALVQLVRGRGTTNLTCQETKDKR